MLMNIPVIDLFAGPGGLGEGFSAYKGAGANNFKLALSIEADEYAHQTLTLRSFYRQFLDKVPNDYYKHLKGLLSIQDLFKRYPIQSNKAMHESWLAVLGKEDIHEIDRRIHEAIKNNKYWVLIGGPPCQPYSIVGRSRVGGIDTNDERLYLYREYYRILAFHSPPIFVMENVKGILSAKVRNNDIFEEILSDLQDPASAYSKRNGKTNTKLKCPGYRIYSLVKIPEYHTLDGSPEYEYSDYLIKAENYGIPQSRHRVILFGIRNDFDIIFPDILQVKPLVPIKKVLSGLPEIRSGLSRKSDSHENWAKSLKKIFNNRGMKRLDKRQSDLIKEIIENLGRRSLDTGGEFISSTDISVDYKPEWYLDRNIEGVCNHSSKSHMIEDLHRYLFLASYADIYGVSPKLQDFPAGLLPQHQNVQEITRRNIFNDRFRVHPESQPSKTITSHISKDGHYYVHPDTSQCRSFTVREAARIQTFPDNYYFCGPKTQQYIQVGNAVPPLLAKQIAEIVMNLFQKVNKSDVKPENNRMKILKSSAQSW